MRRQRKKSVKTGLKRSSGTSVPRRRVAEIGNAAQLLSSTEDAGLGVRGMRDRVHFFNGRFTVRSAPGSGTVVEAEIPLPSADTEAR